MWKENPDLRFGQLVMNIETGSPSVIWNKEEDEWLEALEKYKNRNNTNGDL